VLDPNVRFLVVISEFSSRGVIPYKTEVRINYVCVRVCEDYNDKNNSNNNSKIDVSDKCNTCSDNKLTPNVPWNNLSYIIWKTKKERDSSRYAYPSNGRIPIIRN
jgi:hypothetical protein